MNIKGLREVLGKLMRASNIVEKIVPYALTEDKKKSDGCCIMQL